MISWATVLSGYTTAFCLFSDLRFLPYFFDEPKRTSVSSEDGCGLLVFTQPLQEIKSCIEMRVDAWASAMDLQRFWGNNLFDLMWVIKTITSHPQITIFIGGMFAIPSHGWFMAMVLPTWDLIGTEPVLVTWLKKSSVHSGTILPKHRSSRNPLRWTQRPPILFLSWGLESHSSTQKITFLIPMKHLFLTIMKSWTIDLPWIFNHRSIEKSLVQSSPVLSRLSDKRIFEETIVEQRTRRDSDKCIVKLTGAVPLLAEPNCIKHPRCALDLEKVMLGGFKG